MATHALILALIEEVCAEIPSLRGDGHTNSSKFDELE